MPLFTTAELADLAAEALGVLSQTCTILRRGVAAAPDAWGTNTNAFGVLAATVPCLVYSLSAQKTTGAEGVITINETMIDVPATVDVTPADRVTVNNRTWEVLSVVSPGGQHNQTLHVRFVQS